MTHKEYNGWTNYETWVVGLWLSNEEGSANYWQEQAERAYESTDDNDEPATRKEEATADLANMLQSEHEEALPEVSGFVADLLNAAMSEVNWYEIAEGLLEDVEVEA